MKQKPFGNNERANKLYEKELEFAKWLNEKNPEEYALISTKNWIYRMDELIKKEEKTFGKH